VSTGAASTTAAFVGSDGQLHAVGYIKTFKLGQCGNQGSSDTGLYYVPSWAFDGRAKFGDLPMCLRCSAILVSDPDPSGRHAGSKVKRTDET
jgi:hypothetical protein